MRWLNVLFALFTNAVPVYGVLVERWSAPTILVLYWLENLLMAVATCLRIAVHRSWTHKRGHYRLGALGSTATSQDPGRKIGGGTFLGEYATFAFIFPLAPAVFVGALVLILGQNHSDDARWQFSMPQFRFGAAAIAAFLAASFVADLPSLPTWSFSRLRAYVGLRMGRVLVLHLTIIFGMFLMAMTESPYSVLGVLIGLKTLVDLAGTGVGEAPLPDKPPTWATRVASRLGKSKGATGADFDAEWRRDIEKAKRQAFEDEEPERA